MLSLTEIEGERERMLWVDGGLQRPGRQHRRNVTTKRKGPRLEYKLFATWPDHRAESGRTP